MADTRYHCEHCGHRFVHENRYLKHQCKQMKRKEAFQQPTGQAAWIFYQKWMKAYNKMAHNANAFLHSQYYNSFIRFAEFIKQVRMPDPNIFIALMKDRDISPTIWTNDQVYALYLEHMDKKIDPLKHAEITINTLFDAADLNDVEIEDVLDTLSPHDIIQMLRERRISPWILLNSPKFTKFFKEKTSAEDRIIMESIIRPAYWSDKFAKHPKIVQQMKVYVHELKL